MLKPLKKKLQEWNEEHQSTPDPSPVTRPAVASTGLPRVDVKSHDTNGQTKSKDPSPENASSSKNKKKDVVQTQEIAVKVCDKNDSIAEEKEDDTSDLSDVSKSFVEGRVEDVMAWPPPKKETTGEERQEGKKLDVFLFLS